MNYQASDILIYLELVGEDFWKGTLREDSLKNSLLPLFFVSFHLECGHNLGIDYIWVVQVSPLPTELGHSNIYVVAS